MTYIILLPLQLHLIYIQIRNHIYYHLGFKLINTRPRAKRQRTFPITVQKINGKQVRSNPFREHDYSLDDPYWDLADNYPEYFL